MRDLLTLTAAGVPRRFAVLTPETQVALAAHIGSTVDDLLPAEARRLIRTDGLVSGLLTDHGPQTPINLRSGAAQRERARSSGL